MELSYLDDKSWTHITREERFYCAHLFFLIRKDINSFLRFLKDIYIPDLNIDKEWEVGYEVCFYRDYIYYFRLKETRKGVEAYSPKRTFDLALFSDDEIFIFEAKVHEIFLTSQVKNLLIDKGPITSDNSIRSLLNKNIDIKAFAIAPKKYFNRSKTFESKWLNPLYFDGGITWEMLADIYNDWILRQAEYWRE